MIQRVFGVLAALAIVGGSAACSSSSSPVTPVGDTGVKTDTKVSDTAKADGETGPVAPADNTVGAACSTVDDCDKTGNGIAHCSAQGGAGPWSPTPFCTQYDQAGSVPDCVGTKTDTTGYPAEFAPCDNGHGLCDERPASGTTTPGDWSCEAPCVADATGKFTTACIGKNSCSFLGTTSDTTTMAFAGAVGTCGGGCSTTADCPAGSACDPILKACLNIKCPKGDADCAAFNAKLQPPGLGPSFKCDDAAGSPTSFCGFHYPKNPGDACDATKTAPEDCFCIAPNGAAAGIGYCTANCKVGGTGDCLTGFTCDPFWNAADSTGKPTFPATFSWPAGTAGYCAKTCTTDTDCVGGTKCTLHGGMGTQKTCL